MNAKYEVSFCNKDFKTQNDKGVAFGENPGEIVNNIYRYYGEDDVDKITITFFPDDCDETVLPYVVLQDYFDQ